MSFDLQWDHQFCLACDKQTDGATYCSESCRLADFEKTSSTPSSGSRSPALAGPSSWAYSKPAPASSKFYLSPAYDFSNAQPYGSTPASTHSFSLHHHQLRPLQHRSPVALAAPERVLSPSSSHSSLSSVRSNNTTTDASQLSEKARSELRAYAISFEQVRLQRRRSY